MMQTLTINEFSLLKLTGHGLLRYLWSADLSKRLSQLIMSK